MPVERTVGVVIDCNLFVQALLNPAGAAARVFERVRSGRVRLFISPETLAEVEEVLSRPRVLNRLPHATPETLAAFLEDTVAHATLLRRVPEKFRFERDPKDAPYLNLAIEAKADYLVSRDRDLLDLMTGHTAECKEFRRRFRQIRVIEPVAFLQHMERTASGA